MRPTSVPGYLALEWRRRWPQGVINSGWLTSAARRPTASRDVLNIPDLMATMKNIDAVFHTPFFSRSGYASVIESGDRVERDVKTFEVNAFGTFNVLRAAQEAGVPKAVVVTSEAARGQRIPITDVEVCDEETPAKPDYVYALTKYTQEVMCEYFTRIEGIKTICLRNGAFGAPYGRNKVGRTLQLVGSSLLHQQLVTRNDMARAAVLAIENQTLEHEVFLRCNATEFTREDVPALRTNPEQVIEKYYPGAVSLLTEYGVDMQRLYESKELWKLDDMSKAERLLAWKPTFTFRDFYENLKAGEYTKDYVFPHAD